MKSVKKRLIIFICVISVLVGSFSLPIKTKAVVGTAVAAFTLSEILTYVISGIAAVGVTVGLNELLDSDEEMYALVNHYLSDTSGIVIDESRRTLVKDEQEISIEDWIDGLGNKYGSQMADQSGDDFLNKLQDMDLRLTYDRQYFDIADGYILTDHDREALGTDKLYITEEEFQELLYALYLKNHGLLKENEGNLPSPSPDQGDDDNNKHKLNWKTLAVTTASIPVAALAVGGKSFFESVGDFFKELLNDDTDPVTQALQNRYQVGEGFISGYNGTVPRNADGKYVYNVTFSDLSGSGTNTKLSGGYLYEEIISSRMVVTYISLPVAMQFYDDAGNPYYQNLQTKVPYKIVDNGDIVYNDVSCGFPVFESKEALQNYFDTGDDSACINREEPKFTYSHILDNTNSINDTLKPLNDIPVTKGLSSSTLKNYIQDVLDNQETLKKDPEEYKTLILPKIDTLVNSAENVSIDFEDDEENPSDGNEPANSPFYGNDVSTDDGFETITNPDPISLPVILPVNIPSVAQKVRGSSDWEYNYSPYFIAIISILIIDFETVKTHTLESLDKLPTLNGTQAVFDSINIIADSISDEIIYPVFSIDTPDILLQFYPYSQIVLLDTKDYAEYFSFVRSAFSVALSIGYIIWMLKQVRVSFVVN